jgi:hypothetical protein
LTDNELVAELRGLADFHERWIPPSVAVVLKEAAGRLEHLAAELNGCKQRYELLTRRSEKGQ